MFSVHDNGLYCSLIVNPLQIKITDVFLGGAFSNFGLAAASWNSQDEEFRTDPLIRIFPR